MTNERAIQILENLISINGDIIIGDEGREALEMAIRSLQQEQPEKSKKDCNGCPHCVDRKDQYGWHFKGCFGGPYKGKFIAEIDECPLKQEQNEVDLDAEIEKELQLHYNDDQDVYWWNYLKNSFHHFYKLGRKQVLQEIYDGKTKPVDKITAAWLDD